jgi:uncharacterized protein YbjQ (UPF0145 family)
MSNPALQRTDFLTTTSNVLDGYDVVQTFGLVRGIVVRSRSVIGAVGVKIQSLFGGNITLLEELCETARAEAYVRTIMHAQALGANAIIALRYDATEVMQGITEVLCYGTAVRVATKR